MGTKNFPGCPRDILWLLKIQGASLGHPGSVHEHSRSLSGAPKYFLTGAPHEFPRGTPWDSTDTPGIFQGCLINFPGALYEFHSSQLTSSPYLIPLVAPLLPPRSAKLHQRVPFLPRQIRRSYITYHKPWLRYSLVWPAHTCVTAPCLFHNSSPNTEFQAIGSSQTIYSILYQYHISEQKWLSVILYVLKENLNNVNSDFLPL